MKNNTFEEIWKVLEKSRNILISLHPKPDGDSLGSCTAMKYVLEKMGKKVTLVSKDDLSENLKEFSFSEEVEFGKDLSEISWEGFDLIIFLDHGTLQHYSKNITDKLKGHFVIKIDHHESDEYRGKLNYVDPKYPSVCSILLDFFKSQKVKIDKKLATRLFLGISTDTGFFTYTNANKAFKDAAFLVEKSVDYVNDIYKIVLGTVDLKIKKLHMILLDNLEIINIKGAKMAYSFISNNDIKKYDLGIGDLRLGIDIIRNIKGIDFELTLSELDDEIKGSFRSLNEINVSLFAQELGGGGHKLAAAFVLKNCDLNTAKKKILKAIEKVGIHKI